MVYEFTLALVVIVLAYANGANDMFKGTATVVGSKLGTFRQARIWATGWTAAGAVMAVLLSRSLAKSFTGMGLFGPEIVQAPGFAISVAMGAALAVLLATRVGLPVSTTHAILGALLGAGYVVGGAFGDLALLWHRFLTPLLVSPLIAIAATAFLYRLLVWAAPRLVSAQDACLCVARDAEGGTSNGGVVGLVSRTRLVVGDAAACRGWATQIATISMPALHLVSSAVVTFARAVNDTPKIAAMLLIVPTWGPGTGFVLVGVAMALGGFLSCHRVAHVMSWRVTSMTPTQGTVGNLVTSGVVLGASLLGLPVSTTHVACGALFGIGASGAEANRRVIASVIAAWFVTLPVAAALAAVIAGLL